MFTGIVEEKSTVLAWDEQDQSWRLKVAVAKIGDGIGLGDSVAVNGCCLTVVAINEDSLEFDVLEESRRVTNLCEIEVGKSVNLERSLRFDGRVGGHFLTGHVDGMGKIVAIKPEGKDVILQIEAPEGFEQYLVYKGCIAVDGISLTVAAVEGRVMTIWLIPHTLEVTTLGERIAGGLVNLEFDLLAKYTENIVSKQQR